MEYIKIGKIVNTHGIKGELRILSDSDFKDQRFVPGATLFVKENGEFKPWVIETYRVHKNFDMVRFEGITNINEVEYLKGNDVFGELIQTQENQEHQFLERDLIGCVVYEDGNEIGEVVDIQENRANKNLVVKHNEKKVYIPYVDNFVIDKDLENKRINVKLIPGIL